MSAVSGGFGSERDRRGFALLGVLWVVVGVAALALAARLAAREVVGTATNRTQLAKARWTAEECVERARAAVHRVLIRDRQTGVAATGWDQLDALVRASPLMEGCVMGLRPYGARLDAGSVDAETLRRLFTAAGVAPAGADSLVDALLDWRDADDDRRPLGAEAEDYRHLGLRTPRNAPFAAEGEIFCVRGMEHLPGADTLLGVDRARIPLNHAPVAVLASLPGMPPEAVAQVVELRRRGEGVQDLSHLAGRLADVGRAELMRHYAELQALTTVHPEAWVLTTRSAAGSRQVTAGVELLLVRSGPRAAVVRRRTWME